MHCRLDSQSGSAEGNDRQRMVLKGCSDIEVAAALCVQRTCCWGLDSSWLCKAVLRTATMLMLTGRDDVQLRQPLLSTDELDWATSLVERP